VSIRLVLCDRLSC